MNPILLTQMADLVLGRACRGCGRVGSELCDRCLAQARLSPPTVDRTRLGVPAWSSSPYDGLARRLVLAYKDGQRSLAGPLGLLLADAMRAALDDMGATGATVVPIPGHRRARRGFDALAGICREAVASLRVDGRDAVLLRALTISADYRPAKSLSRRERLAALEGAFVARAGVDPPAATAPLLVVDDVLTTGATLTQAVSALRAVGFSPAGACVVAAA